MSALHSELVPIPGLASRDHAPAVLNYHTSDALDEHAVLKVLGGFAFGSLIMGVMLSFGAVAVRELTGHVTDVQREFMVRCATLFGLGFVGASLLLVTLKAREDRSPVALHPRHWIIAAATGAGGVDHEVAAARRRRDRGAIGHIRRSRREVRDVDGEAGPG